MAAPAVALDLMTLLDAPGVGPSRVRKVLRHWKLLEKQSNLLDEAVLRSTLTAAQVAALPESRDRILRHWEELARQRVFAISLVDPLYPQALLRTLGEDAPVLLFCSGNLELLDRWGVGFCGSRAATEKGLGTAWDSADLLARSGLNVVSGFASGVDMSAHRAALAAGGTTTVVLAEGILRFRVKKEIQAEWAEDRTLVVSEFGPNAPWSVSHAMQRNRTICGLSRAMILIEARSTGGSIQAGRDCLRLGLPLFAAVYEGMPESATGNQELLGEGARRLMKSRAMNRPNVGPVVEAVRAGLEGLKPLAG